VKLTIDFTSPSCRGGRNIYFPLARGVRAGRTLSKPALLQVRKYPVAQLVPFNLRFRGYDYLNGLREKPGEREELTLSGRSLR
jgi:hypothetical protein